MTTTRPPRLVNTPRRAKLVALALLAATMAVAYLRTREAPPPVVGEVQRFGGWRVAFAPPVGWHSKGEILGPHDGRTRTYVSADQRRRVSLSRMPVKEDQSPESVCREVLDEYNILPMMGSPHNVHISETKLGDWPAVMLDWTPEFDGEIYDDHVFVLGAFAPSAKSDQPRLAYVLQFQSPAPLAVKDERLWEQLMATVVTEGDRP